jgi:isoquinoline 1-oxidoreductase beta subunit
MTLHKVSAGLDSNGNLIAYQHRIVGQSNEWSRRVNGVDMSLIAGIVGTPYNIPNILVDVHEATVGIPTTPYRGAANHCFVIETFIDEVAHAAGRDPLEFRRALLVVDPRVKRSAEQANAKTSGAVPPPRERMLLELVAEKAGWGTPLGPNRGRGIAVHDAYGSALAQVAEVTARPDGTFKVDRVVCAIDCGTAVNPDVIRAQIEGGTGFNLSDTLYGEITLKNGVIEQSNFHNYPSLRIHEMPKVEVHIVPSSKPPTGVGEPGAVVTGAAVANAVFAATGKRTYRLPFHRQTI